MIYHSVLILGLNDLGPVNIEELIFLVITLLMATLMNSLVFSNMAVIASVFS